MGGYLVVFERYLISRSGMKEESPDVEIRMCWQDSLHTCMHAFMQPPCSGYARNACRDKMWTVDYAPYLDT